MKNLCVGSALAMVVMSSLLFSSHAMAWDNDCEFSRDVEREISVNDSLQLTVVAGAGTLAIVGDTDRQTVLIEAKLCAARESQLADMDISSELKGGVTYIETEFAKGRFWGSDNDGASIDLTLYVPINAKLDVTDSSGKARVEGVASLVMVDSSGSLGIEDVAGDVTVKDSSGSLRIERIKGNVSVTDSSGSIKVEDVGGDFTVEVDRSGSIDAEKIKGNVLVRRDSSGSINVYKVGGDFTVGRDSSGGIVHNQVAGNVSLPD
ncbi:MAG: hypothetical protein ACI854_002183 [Arenicella sp.]|jgi:hypothetical protein